MHIIFARCKGKKNHKLNPPTSGGCLYPEGQCDLLTCRVESPIHMTFLLLKEGIWARAELLLVEQRVSLGMRVYAGSSSF